MMRRLAPWILGWVMAFAQLTHAQIVPSAEQLEMLREMSEEDRSALMQQLGIPVDDRAPQGNQDGEEGRTNGRTGPERRLFEEKPRLEKVLKPGDSVLLEIGFIKGKPARVENVGPGVPPITIPEEPPPVIEPEERLELQRLLDLIQLKNPYRLDANGAIELPGFAPITLAGLDDVLATRRLATIPDFKYFDVKVSKLPVRSEGVAALQPFGYDLFKSAPSSFAPVIDVPVPAEYIVGPGDQLNVQLYGSQNRNLRLKVARDGRISFPELGPINVGGRTFSQVSADLESRVAKQMIGVRASVSMGETRSIRIFVLGEVVRPGSIAISGLGTITSALFAAGGVRPIGSLRNVQLKRQGTLVRTLDLYDLLIHGDTSDDAKLLPGDVVFVPPLESSVAVDGEVRRPAIYELRGEENVAAAIRLAGGLTADADLSRAALVRVDPEKGRAVVNVSLGNDQGRGVALRNGDSLRILQMRPILDSGITVEGHVYRPAAFAWHEGVRLSHVLPSVDELRPNADLHYVMIRRELQPDRRLTVVSADLSAALRSPGSDDDVLLQPRDRITVFDNESGRGEAMRKILDELRRQSRFDRPSEVVRIDGRVKIRGEYPLEPNMRISDLLRAGGGLQDAAYGALAELTRYVPRGGARQTELIDIDLAAILRGDKDADLILQPFDFVSIKELPEWSEQEQVTISGEVRFPGIYPIQRGETIRSVLERAGGLTSLAFERGAVFTRRELREREQQALDRLAERLQSDLTSAALQGAQANQAAASQALTVGQSLLTQLKSTRAVGRLVIDLNRVIAAPIGSADDIALRDGDALVIPKLKQEITVIGEVQNSTSHLYRSGLSRDDYIDMSGGPTRKADKGRIYVVKADGSVVSGESSAWFSRSAQVGMRPGDTIVVPLNTERLPPLPFWQAVTQIVYNLAIAAAAVNSF